MATSQNGYSIDASLVASYTVPTTTVKLNLRKGDVSVVLLDWALWWHRNISPLKQAQCGGYNNRVIKGSRTKSNHASATAEDLNWQEFPQGPRRTTAAQRAKIHDRLDYYEGVIRWGGDYTGTLDEMHAEINRPPADVTRVANKIRRDSKPKRTPVQQQFDVVIPELREGDDDNDFPGYDLIVRMQRIVRVKDDGAWGPKTTTGIAAWMKEPAAKCKVLNEHIYRNIFGAWSGKK